MQRLTSASSLTRKEHGGWAGGPAVGSMLANYRPPVPEGQSLFPNQAAGRAAAGRLGPNSASFGWAVDKSGKSIPSWPLIGPPGPVCPTRASCAPVIGLH
jgi:hypothetical protein